MPMTVIIEQGTGATPTWATVTTVKWGTNDLDVSTLPVATPTATGANFSFVKTFSINITVVAGLSMSDVKVGKVANEATTGTKLWHRTDHAIGSYIQATAAPAATGDNNVTAPAMNGTNAAVTAVPLIGSASIYSVGPHSTTGRKGNIVEACLGVDFSNTTAGSAVSTPVIRFTWVES